MSSPPARRVSAVRAGLDDEAPKDYYSSPEMARLCGFALYEEISYGIVFAATERTEPGEKPVCLHPDCVKVGEGIKARLLKGTRQPFLGGGLMESKAAARRAANGAVLSYR